VQFGAGDGPDASPSSDVYLGDGSIPNTLQNPGTGTDARSLLRTYAVKSGDNLAAIANHFGLANIHDLLGQTGPRSQIRPRSVLVSNW